MNLPSARSVDVRARCRPTSTAREGRARRARPTCRFATPPTSPPFGLSQHRSILGAPTVEVLGNKPPHGTGAYMSATEGPGKLAADFVFLQTFEDVEVSVVFSIPQVGEGAIDAFEANIGEGIAGLTGEACGSITGYAELEGSSAVKTAAVGGCVPDHAIALVRHWVQHSVGQRVASSTHCSPGSASQASGLAQITLSYPIDHHEVVVRPALHAHRVVDAL